MTLKSTQQLTLAASHNRIALSAPADARIFPSGLQATLVTVPYGFERAGVVDRSMRRPQPDRASSRRGERLPIGLQATLVTMP